MSQRPSPLLGYNTNVRHKGKLYHIQTEDSGVDKPHIITHLFADGGRIVASAKTEYGEHVGSVGMAALVKAKMQAQHKAMFVALRDGVYDEQTSAPPVRTPTPPSVPDSQTLDRAAEAKLASSAALRPIAPQTKRQPPGAGLKPERGQQLSEPQPGPARAAEKKPLDDAVLTHPSEGGDAGPPRGKR